MASFVGRLQNILVSKWFAVALISLLLSCLSIFPIANASAQTCGGNWDISGTSGIKTDYQPGETISGNISFKINNPADCPSCIQQILVALVDSQYKVFDVKCLYDGMPKVCPQWTTGTVSISWENPANPGTYRIIANQDANYSCLDAKLNFRPKESYKNIATITISTSKPDQKSFAPTKEDGTTSSTGGGTGQNGLLPKVGSITQIIIIVCVIGLVIFLLIRFLQWRLRKRDELFERVCKAIKEYVPPPIRTSNERAYQFALHEYLKRDFPSIKMELQTEDRDRPDLVIKHIGIEIKGPTRNASLENLLPKCMKYGKFYSKIIFVLFAREYSESKLDQVKEEIRKRYPEISARFIPK